MTDWLPRPAYLWAAVTLLLLIDVLLPYDGGVPYYREREEGRR